VIVANNHAAIIIFENTFTGRMGGDELV